MGSHQAAGFGLSRIHRPALPAGAPLYAWARPRLHASFANCRKSAAAQRSLDKLLTLVDHERAVTLWSRLHGHVSLEIEGNFASTFEAAIA